MSERAVEAVYAAPGIHWVGDGFRVRGYLARHGLVERLSPFLLLDYHEPYDYPPTHNTRRGVGPHPHRGFETVTLAFAGSVAHHDSMGNGGVIGPGDAQWMTAASGILHREYHEEAYARAGGPLHMAQIWVNLPRAHKMDPPRYQTLLATQMGAVALPHDAGHVRVIAGDYEGVKGPAQTFTPVRMLDVRLAPGGRAAFALPPHENAAVLVLSGDVSVNGATRARTNDLVVLANAGERFVVEAADAHAQLLLLGGEPIDEPVVQYGPFVMNTEREIEQAIDDFNEGRFGQLDD